MPSVGEILDRIFAVLRVLRENPGITITELAAKTGMSRVATTHLVSILAEKGLIKKKLGGMPRRAELYLTELGRCLIECLESRKD